jgi:hypothetical protein
MSESLKLIGIIFFAGLLIYIIMILFKAQFRMVEGMTNEDNSTVTVNTKSGTGIAGGSTNYAEAIKSQVVKLQDELLISKYRKDYENAIIHLDDLAGLMMIKVALSMKITNDPKEAVAQLNSLNILKEAKESLNSTMKFLDSQ